MYHITWTKISGVELKMNYTNTIYRFLVLKFNILNLKRSNFCNLQNFVELYYLLHLMIERKHLHFSSQSLLRERRLCTINHVLEIHNNTTKKFSNFFLFFVLFFVISKQGEKGFSSEKFFNLEKEDSTILFQLIIYTLSFPGFDVRT